MSIFAWRIANFLFSVALALMAGHFSPRPTMGDAVPWLETYWKPALLMAGAAFFAGVTVTLWLMERRQAKALQAYIRENPTSGFPDTDAIKVLAYLRTKSAWAWKRYARLNFWEMVGQDDAVAEFKRAAGNGEVVTQGWLNGEAPSKRIDRNFWSEWHAEVRQVRGSETLRLRSPGRDVGTNPAFDRIGVANADIQQTWPQASLTRKALATAWVWAKRQWYGLLGLPSYVGMWCREFRANWRR